MVIMHRCAKNYGSNISIDFKYMHLNIHLSSPIVIEE